MKLENSLTPYTKINSKWIKDTVKLLEENIGSTLFDINHSKIFFDPPPRVMEIKDLAVIYVKECSSYVFL